MRVIGVFVAIVVLLIVASSFKSEREESVPPTGSEAAPAAPGKTVVYVGKALPYRITLSDQWKESKSDQVNADRVFEVGSSTGAGAGLIIGASEEQTDVSNAPELMANAARSVESEPGKKKYLSVQLIEQRKGTFRGHEWTFGFVELQFKEAKVIVISRHYSGPQGTFTVAASGNVELRAVMEQRLTGSSFRQNRE